MRYCTNCGHQLGVGRYCTNCGARVPVAPTDVPARPDDYPTNMRLGPLPAIPTPDAPSDPRPAVGPEPSTARYPLYADSPSTGPADSVDADEEPTASYAVAPAGRRRLALPWVIGFVALALVALVGGGLLLLDSSDDDPAGGAERAARADGGDDERDDGQDADGPDAVPDGALVPDDVEVPSVAPASVDEDGRPVTYEGTNLLDADPRTCWRMAGDGSGAVLRFSFDEPVTITGVGLINGYAKVDPPHDWYDGNRRITTVVWAFDDGTEVSQELAADDALQSVPVDAVETSSVELRIVEVTAPGTGPDARDFTAISDVELSGS